MADQPHIVGSWITDDQTDSHLEVAQTDAMADGQPVLALRDTYAPTNTIYVTRKQLQAFCTSAVQNGTRTGQLISSGR